MSKGKLPKIKVKWFRFGKHPATYVNWQYSKARSWGVVGEIETGKSSLCETIASNYAERDGSTVIDLFGSGDNEGLAWLRSPFHKKALLLKGKSAMVSCNQADVMNALDVSLETIANYKVIISASALYSSFQEEWYSIAKLMEKFMQRTHWDWPHCVIIREASNLIYSRMTLGEGQDQAKASTIYMMRQMRHFGFALAWDTLRWRSIDINARSPDYIMVKAQGIRGLKHTELNWLYKYFDPFGLMKMGPAGFVMVSRYGPLGVGLCDLPEWHKREREDLLGIFDIDIEYRQREYTGGRDGVHLGDTDHATIIKLRIERKLSMEKIGKALPCSPRTVHQHIKKHNSRVEGLGECDKCLRVNSKHAKTMA
jgi:hypothetical protein